MKTQNTILSNFILFRNGKKIPQSGFIQTQNFAVLA